ncbi:hypothetical protein T12_14316 [Trichinella patagoniensis]|uniref:Uncharacterized protein n=1 Tax=Trichinella patagoniensis TaxID=990121 RepID=A0A0V0YYN5_9BILA|nr:hypothetical protein T12_14316 [Trichinella patagoniensis]
MRKESGVYPAQRLLQDSGKCPRVREQVFPPRLSDAHFFGLNRKNPFTKLKLTIVACYTYFADLFAQGLDLSGLSSNLHNVLVGVPEAMHYDVSVRHRNVIANIALNSMQIFALSQFAGYRPPANTTANMGVHNSEGISVICRQEIRITIAAPIMPLDAVAIVDSDKVSAIFPS